MQEENKQENNKEDKEEDTAKYFDESKYRTAIVNIDGESEVGGNDKVKSLIELLTDPKNKDFKEEALLTLKKEKAGDVLIDAIKQSTNKDYRHTLVAACWESEINYSNHFSFFIDLAMDEEYLVSLEAITVIGNMEGPFEDNVISDGVKKLKEHKNKLENEQQVLINDLINQISDWA